jgi:IS5 family transposase
MARERFRKTGEGSFFGELVYQRTVPEGHFLRKLKELLPWEALTQEWVALYKGGAEYGPPPYHPALVLKMLFLAYLYNLSERQVELFVGDSLSAKYFLGLGADERCPDSTTLTVFKSRLLKAKGEEPLQKLLAKVVRLARKEGVVFGRIQVVDSVHTFADVNVEKDGQRRRDGRPPHDPDARWGTKGKRKEQSETGATVMRLKHFYGYKTHASLNTGSELITALTVTPGQAYDGHELPDLVRKDQAQRLKVRIYTGDKGYDDGENHELLARQGLGDALCLNRYRTEKKDRNKEVWLKLREKPAYGLGLRERYRVERKFGEMKRAHGYGRCRYVGLARYALQAYLTVLAVNLKRLVKLVSGVEFRCGPPPRAYRARGALAT